MTGHLLMILLVCLAFPVKAKYYCLSACGVRFSIAIPDEHELIDAIASNEDLLFFSVPVFLFTEVKSDPLQDIANALKALAHLLNNEPQNVADLSPLDVHDSSEVAFFLPQYPSVKVNSYGASTMFSANQHVIHKQDTAALNGCSTVTNESKEDAATSCTNKQRVTYACLFGCSKPHFDSRQKRTYHHKTFHHRELATAETLLDRGFSCPRCQKTLTRYQQLGRHLRLHNIPTYQQLIGNTSPAQRKKAPSKQSTVTKKLPIQKKPGPLDSYPCLFGCKWATFKYTTDRVRHHRSTHSEELDQIYKLLHKGLLCPCCEKKMITYGQLCKHLSNHGYQSYYDFLDPYL